MKIHWLVLVASLLCASPGAAHQGHAQRTGDARTIAESSRLHDQANKGQRPITPHDIRERIRESDRREHIRQRYFRILEDTLTQAQSHQYRGLGHALDRARYSSLINPLSGNLSWLSVRVTGEGVIDADILGLSTILAERTFSHPYEIKNISVLGTGLSGGGLKRIEEVTHLKHDSLQANRDLVNAIIGGEWTLTSRGSEKIDLALRPFRDRLLIVVAHHGPDEFGRPSILFEDGRRKRRVSAEQLRLAFAQNRVNLFVLGCDSSSSQPLGTRGPIREPDAIAGIERLFSSGISTYGDIFKQLSGDRVQLIFDIVLAADGVFGVVDVSSNRIPPFDSKTATWTYWIINAPEQESETTDLGDKCSSLGNASEELCKPTTSGSDAAARERAADSAVQGAASIQREQMPTGTPDRRWSLDGFLDDAVDTALDSAEASAVALALIGVLVWIWSGTLFRVLEDPRMKDANYISHDFVDSPGCLSVLIHLGFAAAFIFLAHPALTAIKEGVRTRSLGTLTVGFTLLITIYLLIRTFLHLRRRMIAHTSS